MTPDQQKILLLNQLKSMVIELDDRLGDNNPWKDVSFDDYDVSELRSLKSSLHELLYAPPSRSR